MKHQSKLHCFMKNKHAKEEQTHENYKNTAPHICITYIYDFSLIPHS